MEVVRGERGVDVFEWWLRFGLGVRRGIGILVLFLLMRWVRIVMGKRV